MLIILFQTSEKEMMEMDTLIFQIPNVFQAKEKFINHHKMKLLVEEKKFGSLVQNKGNKQISFDLLDLDKNVVAVAYKKYLKFGSSIQIYDMYGGLMGTIQHRVHNPLTNPIQKYAIFDAYGNLLASSKQQDGIDRHLSLFDKEDNRVFNMRRKLNLLKDNWEIQILDGVDKRLAIFLPIFVSSQLGKQLH